MSPKPRPKGRADHRDIEIGRRVRTQRLVRGISQTEFGRQIGSVTFQQVGKYENGVNRISASRLAQIAKALELPMTYFFPDDAGAASSTRDEAEPPIAYLSTEGADRLPGACSASPKFLICPFPFSFRVTSNRSRVNHAALAVTTCLLPMIAGSLKAQSFFNDPEERYSGGSYRGHGCRRAGLPQTPSHPALAADPHAPPTPAIGSWNPAKLIAVVTVPIGIAIEPEAGPEEAAAKSSMKAAMKTTMDAAVSAAVAVTGRRGFSRGEYRPDRQDRCERNRHFP